jgi:hypothetical protein
MTSAVGDAAALTDLLDSHELIHFADSELLQCEDFDCGWEEWTFHGSPVELHRAHVAEVIAGYVTTARAQAWNEGFRAGYGRDGAADNPYQTTENTSSNQT